MKLIIQIPCLNEEDSLPITVKDLPRTLDEFPELNIEWLIIDDGSTDKTVEVAKEIGVDHIVSLKTNKGLAFAWTEGIKTCLEKGADIIVNLDADNQYSALNIPDLIRPVIKEQADMVIGYRTFKNVSYFSPLKCALQTIGSKFVSFLAGISVKDATSGFRAYNIRAAKTLNVYSKYTYTLETIIHATQSKLAIVQVPIEVNPKLRESRLLKSNFSYIKKSLISLSQVIIIYNPFKILSLFSLLFFIPGILLGVRFAYYFFCTPYPDGKIQSLILSSLLIMSGLQIFIMGIIGNLISINRKLIEKKTL